MGWEENDMTRKTGWRKFGSKGIVLLLSLLLLIGLAGGAFAQTEQPLENYATSIQAELTANAQGEAFSLHRQEKLQPLQSSQLQKE